MVALQEAYRQCERLARDHYENFPVASWLLPRRMRPHIAAIYAFARDAGINFAVRGTHREVIHGSVRHIGLHGHFRCGEREQLRLIEQQLLGRD